jgi:hypothetical protein
MEEIPFYKTIMGHTFYERDFPHMVEQLKRIADALEKLEVKK